METPLPPRKALLTKPPPSLRVTYFLNVPYVKGQQIAARTPVGPKQKLQLTEIGSVWIRLSSDLKKSV